MADKAFEALKKAGIAGPELTGKKEKKNMMHFQK